MTAALQRILDKFAGGDAGRSVALRTLSPFKSSLSVEGDVTRPAASIMKLPLIMALYQKAERGLLNLEERVPVSAFAPTRYVSVLAAFDRAHELSLREICRLAILTSDNPLATYIQSLVSFDEANAVLKPICKSGAAHIGAGFSEAELGPKNRVNVMTAEDALDLLAEIRGNPLYADLLLAMRNNLRGTRIPALLPETAIVAHKTGTLASVINDAGYVQDGAVAFDIAFLTDAQSDPQRTINDISACALAVHECVVRSPA